MNYLLEGIVIGLLGITVVFCWRLNGKIADLKNSRKDMVGIVKSFDSAVFNTHKSLESLKEASVRTALDFNKHAAKAGELIEDLSFMNDSSRKVIEKLEDLLSEARQAEIKLSKVMTLASNGDKITAEEKPISAADSGKTGIGKRSSRKRNKISQAVEVAKMSFQGDGMKNDLNI